MSTILDRLPALATTGVGSLPFTSAEDAARHATGAYTLPFCPQLPRLDGDMVSEWLGADPCRCGWSADRDRERPAAWDRFLGQLDAHPPDHAMVKLQVTGPVTLAIALERGAGRIAHQSLLTPSCGTGRLSPERERLIANVLDTAARSTRDAVAALMLRRLNDLPGHHDQASAEAVT